ncbi:hypothetical protein [Polymorphobacter sp.]|uniref:hypothetical protein n=1 Tax=Polymorphobacter sp. TaxID=1909290 RepID=UPI003F71788D
MRTDPSKSAYTAPDIIDVGDALSLTNGHGTPVGDAPHDGTTGYYNAAKNALSAEVELDD